MRVLLLVLFLGLTAWADTGSVDRLLGLMRQRLDLAPAVARAKWNTQAPIEDRAREWALLKTFPKDDFVRDFFRDQMAAGKLVQYQLQEEWRTARQGRFADAVPLADLRPRFDALTPQLVKALREVEPLRTSDGWEELLEARAAVELKDVPEDVRDEALATLR